MLKEVCDLRGTSLRCTIYEVFEWTRGRVHRSAVLWDCDYDTRVLDLLKCAFRDCLRDYDTPPAAVTESKGGYSVVVPGSYLLDLAVDVGVDYAHPEGDVWIPVPMDEEDLGLVEFMLTNGMIGSRSIDVREDGTFRHPFTLEEMSFGVLL